MSGFTLTVRADARVRRRRHERLDEAMADVRRTADELAGSAPARAVGGRLMRRFDPVQQVVARLELKGPGLRAGVDIRGDGSAEAYTGRIGRTLVHQQPGESPYDALARQIESMRC